MQFQDNIDTFLIPSQLITCLQFFLQALVIYLSSFLCLSASASDKQNQLETLRNRIQAIQMNLAADELIQKNAMDTLKDIEQSISHSKRNLLELKEEKQIINKTLKRILVQYKRLKLSLIAQQDTLRQLLYQQYLGSQKTHIHALLNLHNPNQIARDLFYYQQISKLQTERIDAFRNHLNQFRTLSQSARKEKAKIIAIEKEYMQQKQILEQEQSKQRTILANISNEIKQQQNEIDKLIQDEKRITALVLEINQLFKQEDRNNVLYNRQLPDHKNQHNAFPALKGKLNLPVRGKLANRFGGLRSGKHVTWQGLFIHSPAGSDIKAIANGRVVFADWLRGFGNLIMIDHSHDYMSLYGNTEALLKQVGDNVYSGDTIGTVGNSGGNLDTGLYFELRHKGKPFDPLTWTAID